MKIPDKEMCFNIINDNKMMSHIIKHSMMVGAVAGFLCTNLINTFPELNIKLAKSAGLLHDITKTQSFTTGEKHADTGGKLIEKLGFPETGDIIEKIFFILIKGINFYVEKNYFRRTDRRRPGCP